MFMSKTMGGENMTRAGVRLKGLLVLLVLLMVPVLGLSGCAKASPMGQIPQISQIPAGNQTTTDAAQVVSRENEGATGLQAGATKPAIDKPLIRLKQDVPVPVLYYHSVAVEAGNELRIPPAQFEEQMAYLAQEGYHSVTLEELYRYLYADGALPAKPVVITFDDGYVDNYTNAYPIMQKYGFTGTVFMVSGWLNGSGYLSEQQLRELADAGWEIGGHTVNHPNLTGIDSATLDKELRESKESLEKILNRDVKTFAYPYGIYSEKVIESARASGYLNAVTTERGWANSKEDPYLLKRVYCYADMGMQEFTRRVQDPNY